MLKVGSRVFHWVDDIEGFREFKIVNDFGQNRYRLEDEHGYTLVRVLDNSRDYRPMNYIEIK